MWLVRAREGRFGGGPKRAVGQPGGHSLLWQLGSVAHLAQARWVSRGSQLHAQLHAPMHHDVAVGGRACMGCSRPQPSGARQAEWPIFAVLGVTSMVLRPAPQAPLPPQAPLWTKSAAGAPPPPRRARRRKIARRRS